MKTLNFNSNHNVILLRYQPKVGHGLYSVKVLNDGLRRFKPGDSIDTSSVESVTGDLESGHCVVNTRNTQYMAVNANMLALDQLKVEIGKKRLPRRLHPAALKLNDEAYNEA